MKKQIIACVLCLLTVCLCACGATPTDPSPAGSSAPEQTTEPAAESTTAVFDYMVEALPQGWTLNENLCTPTYLDADWGDGKDAPHLTVSVFDYEDPYGYGKVLALATAVQEREKDSSEIFKEELSGLSFMYLSYPSPNSKKLLRYEFYGQTEPDAQHRYKFVVITMDNVKDAEQFEALRAALDSIDFPFGKEAESTKKAAASTTKAQAETTKKAAASTTKPQAETTKKAAASTTKPQTKAAKE